jgi:hypothetical protein
VDKVCDICEVVLAYLRIGPAWAADMPERMIRISMSDGIVLVVVCCQVVELMF